MSLFAEASLPRANQRPVLSLCDKKTFQFTLLSPRENIICQLKQNLQVELSDIKGHYPHTSNCSQKSVLKQSPPAMERNAGESTAPLQRKPMCLCACVSGALILHEVTKAWHYSSTRVIEPGLCFGIIYPIATVRPFPISRYGFVLLCSLNEVFPKRVMAVASAAVRWSFISSKR